MDAAARLSEARAMSRDSPAPVTRGKAVKMAQVQPGWGIGR